MSSILVTPSKTFHFRRKGEEYRTFQKGEKISLLASDLPEYQAIAERYGASLEVLNPFGKAPSQEPSKEVAAKPSVKSRRKAK